MHCSEGLLAEELLGCSMTIYACMMCFLILYISTIIMNFSELGYIWVNLHSKFKLNGRAIQKYVTHLVCKERTINQLLLTLD